MTKLCHYFILLTFICGATTALAKTDLATCSQQSQLTTNCIQAALNTGATEMQQTLAVQTKSLPKQVASSTTHARNFLQVQSKNIPLDAGTAIQEQPAIPNTNNQPHPQNIFKN